jgi:hypothetical protein
MYIAELEEDIENPARKIGDPFSGLDRALTTLRDQPCSTVRDQ